MVAVLGAGVSGLEFTTGQETLVDSGSDVYRDNARFQDGFGGEPMLVLVTGDIRAMATGEARDEITALEDDLRATGEFDAVVGPATALDFAVGQLSVAPDMFAGASERDPTAAARLAAETARLGAAGEQSFDNPAFVDFLLFDGDGRIRPGLRDNFLDRDHALVIVRLPGNASIEQQAHGAAVVDEVVARHPIAGVEALASGPPELLAEINDYLQGGMATLGVIAVGVMVVVLLLVFRARWPLLPLAVVVVSSSPYGDAYRRTERITQLAAPLMGTSEHCARTVAAALTAARPRSRYLVGPDARLTALAARTVPGCVQDLLTRRLAGL